MIIPVQFCYGTHITVHILKHTHTIEDKHILQSFAYDSIDIFTVLWGSQLAIYISAPSYQVVESMLTCKQIADIFHIPSYTVQCSPQEKNQAGCYVQGVQLNGLAGKHGDFIDVDRLIYFSHR